MVVLEELDLSEKEAVEELKKRVKVEIDDLDIKNENELYLRFLRARDFKMDLSEDMLRRHIEWYKTNNIANILTDYIQNEVALKYLPMTRLGFDKDGEIVRYFAMGAMDGKGLMKAARKNDIIKTLVSFFEKDVRIMKEQSAKLGKPIQQWTYILDFEGYTLAKATHKPMIECLLSIFQLYEANYPERLKAGFAINTSIYFSMIYSIIKPLLSAATVRKVSIYGKDGWKNELLKRIDADVLPVFLGGKRTDPDGDPLCPAQILHAEVVPEELYMCKSVNRISSQPGAKKLIISRKSKAYLPLKVDYSGSMIEWAFETESRDIGFRLYYKKSESSSSKKELIPMQRIDAHLLSETGMFKCKEPGVYVLVFDNTYSWIHRKEVYCKVSIISPDGVSHPC